TACRCRQIVSGTSTRRRPSSSARLPGSTRPPSAASSPARAALVGACALSPRKSSRMRRETEQRAPLCYQSRAKAKGRSAMATVERHGKSWRAVYTGPDGGRVRETVPARTKAEAKELAAKLERRAWLQRRRLEVTADELTGTLGDLCRWW